MKQWWVEILAAGKWIGARGGEITVDLDDLKGIVTAHDAVYPDLEPVLRLGDHPGLEPGIKPAVGWVPKLKVDGDKLLALFSDVPEIALKAFEAKRYKKVSAGLWRNWRHKGKTYPLVLNHVAILGAELPAVTGLKSLQAYLSDGISLSAPEDVVYFSKGECKPQEDDQMATELEIKLQAKLDVADEANVTLKASNKTLTESNEKLEKENKTMKADAADLSQKADQSEVETFVSQAINDKKILSKDKDDAITTGLALKTASVNLSEGDKDPFKSWKTMVTNGADVIDLKENGKTGEEDEGDSSEAQMKAGADAAKAATGQKFDS